MLQIRFTHYLEPHPGVFGLILVRLGCKTGDDVGNERTKEGNKDSVERIEIGAKTHANLLGRLTSPRNKPTIDSRQGVGHDHPGDDGNNPGRWCGSRPQHPHHEGGYQA